MRNSPASSLPCLNEPVFRGRSLVVPDGVAAVTVGAELVEQPAAALDGGGVTGEGIHHRVGLLRRPRDAPPSAAKPNRTRKVSGRGRRR